MNLITFTMTCGRRLPLLKKTLASFFSSCEELQLISRYIAIADRASPEELDWLRSYKPSFEVLETTKPGHVQALNQLFQLPATEFVVHWEDDWETITYKPFLQSALKIMAADPQIAVVTFRNRPGIPANINGVEFSYREYQPTSKYRPWCYPTFSLNPGLFRMDMLRQLMPFRDTKRQQSSELEFGIRFMAAGYKAAFLAYDAVEHIGKGQTAYV